VTAIARSDRAQLILRSFLMLFVELALIRWAGSNVVYLSYFSNFILLGSFLGIGIGFLRGDAKADWFRWAPVGLTGLVAFVLLFPVQIDRTGDELIYYGGHTSGLPIWLVLPIVFVAVAVVLAMLAQGVARVFSAFEPLEAYRLDIIGSIAGIVGFSALSFLRSPPLGWALVAALVFVLTRPESARLVQTGALVALVLLLGFESLAPNDSWSPYYKVTAFEPEELPGALAINVNGIPHQTMLTGEQRRSFVPAARPLEIFGDAPERVLIIGSGNGVDVASVLETGAGEVHAVEIDPRIYDLGKTRNPEQPYSDPRVRVTIDDGRAVLERDDETYDLILFALPDSLSLVSGQSSLRLESYLFTVEALTAAKERLEPDGVFAMYNSYREAWLVDRMAGTLEQVFGAAPCVESSEGNFAVLAVANDGRQLDCETWQASGPVVEAPTDDYPFPYLRDRAIPSFYLVTIALILVASVIGVRLAAGPLKQMSSYFDLFLMGAAFLLLETKHVVQFALLFGTTWFVNALVFAGVLLSVYLAVEVSRRFVVRNMALLYAALLVAIAVAWSVPTRVLLELDPAPRFVAAVALAFTPIFIANVVFAQRFRDVSSSTVAFGANLLGAVVGGLLEYTALILGYRSLLFVVALLYGGAFLFGRLTWMRSREVGATPTTP
jgi:hypothetical protein